MTTAARRQTPHHGALGQRSRLEDPIANRAKAIANQALPFGVIAGRWGIGPASQRDHKPLRCLGERTFVAKALVAAEGVGEDGVAGWGDGVVHEVEAGHGHGVVEQPPAFAGDGWVNGEREGVDHPREEQ